MLKAANISLSLIEGNSKMDTYSPKKEKKASIYKVHTCASVVMTAAYSNCRGIDIQLHMCIVAVLM